MEAGVTDAANREITGRGRFLATYGTFRVNVEPVSYAVRAGEMAKFRVTTVDYDDKPVSTRVHVQLVFRHYQNGTARRPRSRRRGGRDDGCRGPRHRGGAGRQSSVQQRRARRPPRLRSSPAHVIPLTKAICGSWARDSLAGTAAARRRRSLPTRRVMRPVTSPTSASCRRRMGSTRWSSCKEIRCNARDVMHSDGKTISFDLPITADSQPNVTVDAFFIKDNTLYQATKMLKVPPTQQQLQVQITPAKDVFQPQQSATYDVVTKRLCGQAGECRPQLRRGG